MRINPHLDETTQSPREGLTRDAIHVKLRTLGSDLPLSETEWREAIDAWYADVEVADIAADIYARRIAPR